MQLELDSRQSQLISIALSNKIEDAEKLGHFTYAQEFLDVKSHLWETERNQWIEAEQEPEQSALVG